MFYDMHAVVGWSVKQIYFFICVADTDVSMESCCVQNIQKHEIIQSTVIS